MFPLEISAKGCIASKAAKGVRDISADYFMNEGKLSDNGKTVNVNFSSAIDKISL